MRAPGRGHPPPAPAWVRWALRRLLTDEDRRLVLAELAELHAHWLERAGRRQADRRYLRQLRSYPLHLLAHNLRSMRTPVPGLRDVSQAARSLLRAPGLTATIVLTVGLGIGGCTTIFAVVDALYLRSLPYPDPGRLQVVFSEEGANRWPLSAVDVDALRSQAKDFSGLAAYARATRTFASGVSAELLRTFAVSPGFFDILGVHLLSGRGPTEADGAEGSPRTALVTLGFARSRLGSTRPDGSDVLGRSLRLDGVETTVLGVLPSDFGPLARGTRVFTTLQLGTPTRKGPFFMFAVGRIRDGVTADAARARLHAITRRLFPVWKASFQDARATWGMEPLATNLEGDSARLLAVLMGAGLFVLLIATANAAGLLLARLTSRETELAVRAALGASRGRIVRHLLSESSLLAGGGAILGLVLARGGIAALPAVASAYLPRLDELGLTGPVLVFALVLAMLSGLVFGLVPALRRHPDARLADELRAGGRGGTAARAGRRTQRLLVAGQLAVSMPLLTGAGLLLSSFAHLESVDPGFAARHVVSMRVSLPSATYPTGPPRARFWKDALERISSIPGVVSVGLSDGRPPNDHPMDNNFDLEDHPAGSGAQPVVPWVAADSAFFATLQVPLLAGRLFDARDEEATDPVVVVDEAWARRFFPGQSAVGHRMRSGGQTTGPWTTVVGVVGDVPFSGLGAPRQGTVYDPYVSYDGGIFLYVRTAGGDPSAIVRAVRARLGGIDPSIPVTDVATADEALQASLTRPRNLTLVISLFSAVALALAALGLYGVTAYGVQQRRGDIAVRLTLGGSPRAALATVTRDGMAVAVAGLGVGLVASLAVTGVLSSMLYGVAPRDPGALAAASLVLLAISMVACLVPGLRAVRVDPASTLREA
jgi:putative ABC transport system permease protein